jgi:hypothetical protein
MIRLYLNDYYDLTSYCTQFPQITETTFLDQDQIELKVTFELINRNGFLDIHDNHCVFKDWLRQKYKLILKDDITGKIYYDGFIDNINLRERGICEINSFRHKEVLKKELDHKYTTITILEFGKLLEKEFLIDVNPFTFEFCTKYYNYYKFSIYADNENKISLDEIIKNVSETLGLWFYFDNYNRLCCYPYGLKLTGYCFELKKDMILSSEMSNSYDKLINNYNIKYFYENSGKAVIEDKDGDNIGYISRSIYGNKNKEIDGGCDSSTIIYGKSFAKLIGNSYIKRYKDVFDILTIQIKLEIANYLTLLDKVLYRGQRYIIIDKEYDYNLNIVKMTLWGEYE